MAKNEGQTVIKKYANRRLYNTGTSTYVTLDDLAEMVKKGEDFTVQDAKSGRRHHPFRADADHLRAGIEDRQHASADLLPAPADLATTATRCRWCVPSFLEHSMKAFSEQQDADARADDASLRRNAADARICRCRMQMVEEQVRRNTEMFQQAMKMFSPFGMASGAGAAGSSEAKPADAKDIDELKEQLRALQTKLEILRALIAARPGTPGDGRNARRPARHAGLVNRIGRRVIGGGYAVSFGVRT